MLCKVNNQSFVEKNGYIFNSFVLDDVEFTEIKNTLYNEGNYVILFFEYNDKNKNQVLQIIQDFKNNNSKYGIIGCIKNLNEINSISSVDSKEIEEFLNNFDLYLKEGSKTDYESLIQVCSISCTSEFHITKNEFLSIKGTEIKLISESDTDFDILQNIIENSCKDAFEKTEMKFPKVLVCIATFENSISLEFTQNIYNIIKPYLLSEASSFLTFDENNKLIKKDEISVNLIFYKK